MKQRVEEAEQRASRAHRAMASSDESNAAHSCELVERAKREITDARRRNEDLENSSDADDEGVGGVEE